MTPTEAAGRETVSVHEALAITIELFKKQQAELDTTRKSLEVVTKTNEMLLRIMDESVLFLDGIKPKNHEDISVLNSLSQASALAREALKKLGV